jgi:hypothetical protein
LGKPLELVQKTLPKALQAKLATVLEKSLQKTLKISISTLPPTAHQTLPKEPLLQGKYHSIATAITGALGGFFGPAGIAIELPITTGLMFRSIANTAQSFGENLLDPNVRMECLQVFAMGSPQSNADDAMTSAYFSQRLAFNTFLNKAAEKGAASMLTRVIARVASRYQIVVTEKIIAEAVPIFGAVGGAVINSAFTNFFNQTAYYHFGLRHLERKYDLETIEQIYSDSLKKSI